MIRKILIGAMCLIPQQGWSQEPVQRIFSATIELNYGLFSPTGISPESLNPSDLRLIDNGREVKVREVRPLKSKSHFVILIDRSDSVWSRITEIREGVRAVIQNMKSADDLSVITFGGSASLNLPRTNDRAQIAQFLGQLTSIRSQESRLTNISAALNLALDHLKLTQDREDKNIILISDGTHTDFKANTEDVIGRPVLEKVHVYSVYIGNGIDRGFPFLKELSERSGGAAIPTKTGSSTATLGALAAHFAKRYTLVYSPLLKEREIGARSVEIVNMKNPQMVQTYARSYHMNRAQAYGASEDLTAQAAAQDQLDETVPRKYPRPGRRMAPITSDMPMAFNLLNVKPEDTEITAETSQYHMYDLNWNNYHVIQSRGIPVFERTSAYFNFKKPFCTISQDAERGIQDRSWNYDGTSDPRLPPHSALSVEVLPVKEWTSSLHANNGAEVMQLSVRTVPIHLYTRFGKQVREKKLKNATAAQIEWGVIYLQCHYPISGTDLITKESFQLSEDEVELKMGQSYTLADLKRVMGDFLTFKISVRGDQGK